MPTPVGPAPPDPDDPDLWTEWDDDDAAWDDGGGYRRGYPTWVVVFGLLALAGMVGVYVLR